MFKDHFGLSTNYIDDISRLPVNRPFINYSEENNVAGYQIIPAGLLEELGIREQNLSIVDFQGIKVLFGHQNRSNFWNFDPFSCIFYMLTRYEEYLDSDRDEHGRPKAENSISYKLAQLRQPWIEIILKCLGEEIGDRFPNLSLRNHRFTFCSSFDIDVPFAFKGRSLLKSIALGISQSIQGKIDINSWLSTILSVKSNKRRDPYDIYDLLNKVHQKYEIEVLYFMLVSNQGKNNGSIDPKSSVFSKLVKKLAATNQIGVHPSYESYVDFELLNNEKHLLERIAGKKIAHSRQHFLRQSIPETWSLLAESGIKNDYSMGYASHCGFRAGISASYPAYNLKAEEVIDLVIHPFCWMDATYRYYQNEVSSEAILTDAVALIENVKNVNGRMVTIFHNDNFTNWNNQRNFKDIYISILEAIFRNYTD